MPEIPPDGAANPTPPESFPNYAGRLREMMRAYHAQVNDRVDATLADLEWRWNAPRAALANTIAALEREMRQAQDAGDTLSYAWLAEADRLARLKASVAGDVQAFAEGARQVVGASQTDAISMGSTAAQEALAATVPPGTSFTFGVPPEDVTTELAGALQPGSPLALLFDGFGATAAQFAQQALFTSVALGESPHVAAQRLEWATNMSRQRAEVIARTETLRAWRGAQMANYRANNDVVQQWMWACDFGPRSCGACIAMDGTYHSLDEELDDHICGRCSALPVTLPWSQILSDAGVPQDTIDGLNLTETSLSAQGGQTASDWFATQAPELQNSILGPAKAEAYRQGDLQLSDLINYAYSPEWGWSLAESSMADLGLDPQQYLADWRAAQAETPPTPERQRQVVARALSEWEQQRAAQIAQAEVRDAETTAAQATRPTEWERRRQRMIDGADGNVGNGGVVGQAAEIAAATTANDAIGAATFNVEPLSADGLAAQSDAMKALISPTGPGGFDADEAKARVSQALAERLADNPEFTRLSDIWARVTEEQFRAAGYEESAVASALAQAPKTPEEVASQLLHVWATGNGPLYPLMQQAIRDEFGLVDALRLPESAALQDATAAWSEAAPGLQSFARAMYDNTQDWLRAQGISDVPLYRGMGFETLPNGVPASLFDGAAQEATIALRPASSFSADAWQSTYFAERPVAGYDQINYSLVLAARVPAELILSTPQTGFGAMREYEVVTLGGRYDAVSIGVDNANATPATWRRLDYEQAQSLLTAPPTPSTSSTPPEAHP